MTSSKRTLALVLAAAGVGTCAVVATPAIGTAAAASTNLQASVAADGTLSSGNRVTSSVALATGRYEVTFNRDVSACAYVATTVNGSSQALQAYTAGGHASANGVFVETKNQGGGLTEGAFDLVVVCGAAATPFAVVGYTGTLARGTTGTSVTAVGPGQYQVQFAANVASCAYVATVGDPSDGIAIDPSGVSTGVGSTANRVYVETKNPGGGLQTGVPFHLVAVCPGAKGGVSGAAVQGDGYAIRSFGDELSFRSSTGKYTAVTRRDIRSCATIATRGSLSTAVPFTPTTVETAASPASNTVALQVRTLLGAGGGLTNQPFYTATVC